MSDTRTYEVIAETQTFRVTVPATARVSYGPVISAAGKAAYGGNTFRVWLGTKATEVQLALFANVISFRDLSLPVQVRAVRKYGTEDWVMDNGTWTGEAADQVEHGWVDFDLVGEDRVVHGTFTPSDDVFNTPLVGMTPRTNRAITIASRPLKET